MDIIESKRLADSEFQNWLDRRQRERERAFENGNHVAVRTPKCAILSCQFPAIQGIYCLTCRLREDDATAHHFQSANGQSANSGHGDRLPRGYQRMEDEDRPKRKPKRITLEIAPAEIVALEEWQNPESGCAA